MAAKAELKSFGTPDEVRKFPRGRLELINVGGATIGRAVFEPGWRWATSVQPIAKTSSCEAPHFQYHVSGRLAIRMDDGSELIAGPGDITSLPSGHDAWVVGDEAVPLAWGQLGPRGLSIASVADDRAQQPQLLGSRQQRPEERRPRGWRR